MKFYRQRNICSCICSWVFLLSDDTRLTKQRYIASLSVTLEMKAKHISWHTRGNIQLFQIPLCKEWPQLSILRNHLLHKHSMGLVFSWYCTWYSALKSCWSQWELMSFASKNDQSLAKGRPKCTVKVIIRIQTLISMKARDAAKTVSDAQYKCFLHVQTASSQLSRAVLS